MWQCLIFRKTRRRKNDPPLTCPLPKKKTHGFCQQSGSPESHANDQFVTDRHDSARGHQRALQSGWLLRGPREQLVDPLTATLYNHIHHPLAMSPTTRIVSLTFRPAGAPSTARYGTMAHASHAHWRRTVALIHWAPRPPSEPL